MFLSLQRFLPSCIFSFFLLLLHFKMYTSDYYHPKPRKSVIRMDPDCAICHAPATLSCDCEAKGLDMAVRQAGRLV